MPPRAICCDAPSRKPLIDFLSVRDLRPALESDGAGLDEAAACKAFSGAQRRRSTASSAGDSTKGRGATGCHAIGQTLYLARQLDRRRTMWSLQDAKNRFSAVVDAALAGQPQEVSRRGKPAVVVVSVAEYRRMLADAVQRRESFAAHLMGFPGPDPGDPEIPRAEIRPRDVEF